MNNLIYPSYRIALQEGTLKNKAEKISDLLQSCEICPRKCKVNRLKGNSGYCKTTDTAVVYSFLSHQGEEPPISGTRGSGTIFFSNCSMSCCYCQNFKFSQNTNGTQTSANELAEIMLNLQKAGCHNINLVSPTHVMPHIVSALYIAAQRGLTIPIVYNTSGYELPQIIQQLEDIVDVYLVDMRYAEEAMAIKFSRAPNYPEFNQQSVLEMFKQKGLVFTDEEGIIQKGLIIRHLVLPNNISGTETIFKFIAEKLSPEVSISLMSQYLPCYLAEKIPEVSRRISMQEYSQAKRLLKKYNLTNGWSQTSRGLTKLAGVYIKPRKLS